MKKATRIKQALKNSGCFLRETVTGKSCRDDRIVVWPDRAVVVRHRAITRFAFCHRANSPAGKGCLVQQCCHHASSSIFTGDAGEKAMTGVGGADTTRLFFSIESQGVSRKIFAPECLLKLAPESLRLDEQLISGGLFSQNAGQTCLSDLCRIGVSLHFAQRDWRIGEFAILVKVVSGESFHPWLLSPRPERRASSKPSPSASPKLSIQ